MSFILPELGFKYDALEPYIDARTMEIHYSRHHAEYTDKFNAALENTELMAKTEKALFGEISKHSNTVRSNGGGFYNHKLFWKFLSPEYQKIRDKNLSDAITKFFGSYSEFKHEFSSMAANLFGSGWVWLVKMDNSELVITTTSNQDNPLMDVVTVRGSPILCLDVWEHAYYLQYQDRRTDYIEAFWNIINWNQVAELYNL
jgi:Fe-Mn family superoxide dismutase